MKNILVVVNPELGAEQPLLFKAAQLAEALNVGVELFSSCFEFHIQVGKLHALAVGESEMSKQVVEYEHVLKAMCDTLTTRGVHCGWSVNTSASLSGAVLEKVEEKQPILVLKESQIHYQIPRSLLHRTDWELIQRCPVPLWLTRSDKWSSNFSFIACVDPTNPNDVDAAIDREILQLSLQLAGKLRTGVRVCHTLAPLAAYAKPFVIDTLVQTAHDEHKHKIMSLLDEYDISEKQLHMQEGYPEVVLNKLISQLDGAVVVIGALARHGINSMLLGSTSQRVLDRVECDVLVVKPDSFQPE